MYNQGSTLYSITPVVKYLLIINTAVLILSNFIHEFFVYFSLYFPTSPYFFPFQYFTYMFMHADFGHLLSNMLGLWVFGSILESKWGAKRFLTYYVLTGIGAGLIYTLFKWYDIYEIQKNIAFYSENVSYDTFVRMYNKYKIVLGSNELEQLNIDWTNTANQNTPSFANSSIELFKESMKSLVNIPMVGASGAVFGLLFAMAYFHGNTMLIFPFPMKIKYYAIGYGLMEYFAILNQHPEDNVAHVAHLAGMLVGFIIIKYWNKTRKEFY